MKQHLSLIVKGSKKNATRAAARRGIPTASCRLVGGGSSLRAQQYGGDVQCYVPCRRGVTERVTGWYGERGTRRNGRGFAPGTLTYFSGSCPSGLAGSSRRRRKRR